MREHVPGSGPRLDVQKHVAGFSNETFYVTRGSDEWVMRRPPRGPLLPTAHDVIREYRFISALYGKARVPRPVAMSEEASVIGTPFYLMERVNGTVIRTEVPRAYDTAEGRRAISEEMVDALVELHSVDWQSAGLPGKAEGYLQRQVSRWSKQWELTRPRTRELPGLDAATDWLLENMPESGPSTVVHGDYKLDNVLFSSQEPRLLAILDWEMATIGDPLADLGYLLSTWGDHGNPPPPEGSPFADSLGGKPITAGEGFLTREEVTARYERQSGRSMQSVTFYHVLAVYKLAIILEGLYMHYLEATASNPESARFEVQVPMLIARMHRLIAGDK